MTCKSIITIGRQYGSGGHEIGQKLAKELGIKCYDKELLDRAAKESGICQNCLSITMKGRRTVFYIPCNGYIFHERGSIRIYRNAFKL